MGKGMTFRDVAGILFQGRGEGFLFGYCQSFERGGAPTLTAAGWSKISASHVRLAPMNGSVDGVATPPLRAIGRLMHCSRALFIEGHLPLQRRRGVHCG